MKILILSDTHGNIKHAEKAIKANKDSDLIVHLGDYYRDAQKLSEIFPSIKMEYITGNCDFVPEGAVSEKTLELCDKKIFITHGHKYSVKWNYDKLFYKAENIKPDIMLFGHTHEACIFIKRNCLFVNPGSASEPRGASKRSYAIIEIIDDKILPKLYSL